MAVRSSSTTKQTPPHTGWRYDSASRGWFSPRFKSFASAKTRHPQDTPHARFWIARREYDKTYGLLKKEGLRSYEEKARVRKEVGAKGIRRLARKPKDILDRHAVPFTTPGAAARFIKRLGKDRYVTVAAYGPVWRYEHKDEAGNTVVPYQWVMLRGAGEPKEWTLEELERLGTFYFGDWRNVETWSVRYRWPKTDTGTKRRAS